jgi:hypothetical protein
LHKAITLIVLSALRQFSGPEVPAARNAPLDTPPVPREGARDVAPAGPASEP